MTDDEHKTHPEFPGFEYASSVDVDAGLIWVGDPCYVLKDKGEKRPKDLGKDWGDICDRYHTRSGYDAAQEERWDYEHQIKWAFMEHAHESGWYDLTSGKLTLSTEEYVTKVTEFEKEWRANKPFVPTVPHKWFANFEHDGGHGGMGTMISTYYGDGGYPVYIQRGKDGRPRRVLIDFDPWNIDEPQAEDVEEAA